MNLKDIILETLQSDKIENKNSLLLPLPLTYDEFVELITKFAEQILIEKNRGTKFIIDNKNKTVIEILYLYIVRSEKFESLKFKLNSTEKVQKGNLKKGILLFGEIGTGKSLLMEALSRLYIFANQSGVGTRVHYYRTSQEIFNEVKEKGIENMNAIYIIDELGREKLENVSYGNRDAYFIDFIFNYHRYGKLCHAITNYNLKQLTEIYGEMIVDRFFEMFNFIVLRGKSRR